MLINCRLAVAQSRQHREMRVMTETVGREMGSGLRKRPTSQKMVQLFGQQTNCKLL